MSCYTNLLIYQKAMLVLIFDKNLFFILHDIRICWNMWITARTFNVTGYTRYTRQIILLLFDKTGIFCDFLFALLHVSSLLKKGSTLKRKWIVRATGSKFCIVDNINIVVDNPVTAAGQLNIDLQNISQWATTWLVSFNPTKTEAMLFSRKLNRPHHPPIFMQNHQITEVDSHKHLGLYLSNDCTWHKHINYITEKAWTRINIMRRLKFKLDRKSLEQIYLVFIRPLLEYGDIIWGNCLQSEKQELEKIQIEAARIATGATKLVSIAALYREIRWDSLDERRGKHKLTLFYKMTNALAPLYLSSLVPQTVSNVSRYNLRNSNDLQTVEARSSLFYNSFLPSAVRAWNSLPSTAKQSDSNNSFKYFLNKDKDSTP